jgi:hypothetical protein
MKPQDEARDELTDAYRQASAEEAGRPGAETRNAILAEAAAAARRRTPAANDSRYLWRGVAGVAVLGFALLLWKQVDHQLPGDAPVVAVAPAEVEGNKMEEAAPVMESVAAALPDSPPPASPAPEQLAAAADSAADIAVAIPARERLAAQQPAPALAPAAAAPAVAGPPAESRAQSSERNELARSASKMSAQADAETDANALLRQHFPQQYQSNTPHRLWLVQDGTGALLRSGELAPGQNLAGLRLEIERELGGQLLRPWRIRSLRNAQGQSIELAIAQTP